LTTQLTTLERRIHHTNNEAKNVGNCLANMGCVT